MKTENKEQKSYGLYRAMLIGILIQVLCVLCKASGIITLSWGYVFVPLYITYAILLFPLIAILCKVLYDNTKTKFTNKTI